MDEPATYVDTYYVDLSTSYLDVSVSLNNLGSGDITISDLTFSGGLGRTSHHILLLKPSKNPLKAL